MSKIQYRNEPFDPSGKTINNLIKDINDLVIAEVTQWTEVHGEAPILVVDSSYTIEHAPIVGSIQIFLNGLRQRAGADYTLSGTTISFIILPSVGDTITVDYNFLG